MSGVVYALTNPALPDLVKIGKTGDLRNRLNQLYSTGVPSPFECLYAKEVDSPSYVEEKLHMALSSKRFNTKREFFAVDKHEVVCLFDLISGRDITPDKEVEPDQCEGVYSNNLDQTLSVKAPGVDGGFQGNSIADLCNQLDESGHRYSKYSTIISRRNKGWTMEQSFGFEVPPNYTEVSGLLKEGYSYFPEAPSSDDNTKPIVLRSLKRIYISQKHFADEHSIPADYVCDKLKVGWDADKIIHTYNMNNGQKIV